VGTALVEKGQITRGRRLVITQRGLHEMMAAIFAFAAVGTKMLDGLDEPDRSTLLAMLRRMKASVVQLNRDREDPSRL
jgi:hypothetical protein